MPLIVYRVEFPTIILLLKHQKGKGGACFRQWKH